MSNAKMSCSSSVLFVVGINFSLFESFDFFIVQWLFSQARDLFSCETCVLQSLEVLWADFAKWCDRDCFLDCCQFRQSFVDT